MLNIQVLGRGAIPRGNGIAPRKDPFPADLETIELILKTGGLSIKFVNPTTGVLIPLTTSNLKKMWNAYGNVETTETSKKGIAYVPPLKKPTEPIREANSDDFAEAIKTVAADIDKKEESKIPSIKTDAVVHSNNKFESKSEPVAPTNNDSKPTDSKSDTKNDTAEKKEDKIEDKKDSNKNDNKNGSQSFKPVNAPEKK